MSSSLIKDIGGIASIIALGASLFQKEPDIDVPNPPSPSVGAAPKPGVDDKTKSGTLLTGATGVTGPAPTRKKTLLGQ